MTLGGTLEAVISSGRGLKRSWGGVGWAWGMEGESPDYSLKGLILFVFGHDMNPYSL